MKSKLKNKIAQFSGILLAWAQRGFSHSQPVALANELGLMNEHGEETLQIDPSAALPIGNRYLVYERGSAYNYGRIAGGVNLPLGISSDSPYALGDLFVVRRFGAKKGFELGIPDLAAGNNVTINQDDLLVVAQDGSGTLLDLTQVTTNGTYWVVGRAVKGITAATTEVAFIPLTPYQVTVSNGGGTYAYAGAGK